MSLAQTASYLSSRRLDSAAPAESCSTSFQSQMQPSPSDPALAPLDTQASIKELLRKSLLGGEIVNTQFYLFSTNSVSSDGSKVTHPHALCANNVILINSSKYFSRLLKSKTSSDISIEIIGDDQEIPGEAPLDDYGYNSDSDLEDNWPPEFPGSTVRPPSNNLHVEPEDDVETHEDRPRSAVSDISILDPEEDQVTDELEEEPGLPNASKNNAVFVQTTLLRSQNARRILVKDTAFRTWYALLYYLYTDEVTFLPLKSACKHRALLGPLEAPKCSAKSMYRLASKVGVEALRDKALEFLRKNITEQNILKELTSSLLHRYPALLNMVLDVLYANIASEPVVAGFSALAKRISRNEVPHGAGIVIGLHWRLLKKHHPDALRSSESPLKKGVKKRQNY